MAKKAEPKKAEEKNPQEVAAQMVMEYFTSDVNEKVREMSMAEMTQLLREIEDTPFWTAILKYNNLRLLSLQSAVNSLDPMTQATAMSRSQGAMTGLVDMQNYIIQISNMKKDVDDEDDGFEVEGVE